MKPLRILITNSTLAGRNGSVLYVRDLALGLLRRGQQPVVYAPESGEVADELREAAIPVIGDLRSLTATPDLVIGNAHPDMMAALLHHPGVPGIYICHAWETGLGEAPKFPRLRRYIAVDETCRDRLVGLRGIPEDRVRIIHNGVDLDRFKPREPLPDRPARAAVFGNGMTETGGLDVIREACRRAGLQLDVMGSGGGQVVSKPEELLRRHDLVFAKARCALEAMATGCAVITCDRDRLGGMVTSQNWPELRRMSFGRRALPGRLDVAGVLAEIAKYDRDDARDVARCIRDVASLDEAITAVMVLCHEVIIEQTRVGSPGPEAEARAASEYIRTTNLQAEVLRLRAGVAREQAQARQSREHAERLERELAAAQTRAAAAEDALRRLAASPGGRLLQTAHRLCARLPWAAEKRENRAR